MVFLGEFQVVCFVSKRRSAVARAPAGPGHLLPDWLCRQAPPGRATGQGATPLPFPGGRSPGNWQIAGGKQLVAGRP